MPTLRKAKAKRNDKPQGKKSQRKPKKKRAQPDHNGSKELSLFADNSLKGKRSLRRRVRNIQSSLSLFGSSTASRIFKSRNSTKLTDDNSLHVSSSPHLRRQVKKRQRQPSSSDGSLGSTENHPVPQVKNRKKAKPPSPSFHDKIPDFSSIEKFSLLTESVYHNSNNENSAARPSAMVPSSTPMHPLRDPRISCIRHLVSHISGVSYIEDESGSVSCIQTPSFPVVAINKTERSLADSYIHLTGSVRDSLPPSRKTTSRLAKTDANLKLFDGCPPRMSSCAADAEESSSSHSHEVVSENSNLPSTSNNDDDDEEVKAHVNKVAFRDANSVKEFTKYSVFDNHDNSPARSNCSQLSERISKNFDAKLKRLSRRRLEVDIDVRTSQSFNESQRSLLEEAADLDEVTMDQSYWAMYLDGHCQESVLKLCAQTEVLCWESFLTCEIQESLRKVGEGVYGEVFSGRHGKNDVAIKVFPIEGKDCVNGEPQKLFQEVLSEILISKKLTDLSYKYRENKTHSFVQLLSSAVVQGSFHPRLDEEWEAYSRAKGSDNENPSFLPCSQLWLVLEYKFAGEPLEHFKFSSYREARSLILQLALSLASAEVQFEFEHRDLHWGNVLVRRSLREKLRYRVGGVNYSIISEGLEITIIDFTVSRMSPAPDHVVYIDMSQDADIFVGEGDYQFDIYRMMREENKDDWRSFNPRTNLMWLHYLLDKFLNATSFPRHDPDCQSIESALSALYDSLLQFSSCKSLVESNFYFLDSKIDF